jgi:ribosomal protein L11 methyltransferase
VRAYRITVRSEQEDDTTALLWEVGTRGIEVRPEAEGRISLLSYFDDDPDPRAMRAALASLGRDVRLEILDVPAVDWVGRFREGFRAFRAGSFDVVPAWAVPPGREAADPDLLVVDPGRAFGTGTHETTRLCLEALEEETTRRPLRRVLDLGTGAGLLAVAAAKRGAAFVAGVDNDPEATTAARRHAELNAVRIHVVQGDGGRPFRPSSFDLVLANLMAPLLLERRLELRGLLTPGAALVLSGLLDSDLAEVGAAYEACGVPAVRMDGEWAALVFRGGPP